jgi:hypothetical protein
MVHDFTWAADKIIFTMWRKDLTVSTSIFLYKTTQNLFRTGKYNQKTVQLMEILTKLLAIIHASTRKKGGDGGMEYAMCTFGFRSRHV